MLNKIIGGASLSATKEAGGDPSAGAMSAVGLPILDEATIDGLIGAFSFRVYGADRWYASRTEDPATKTVMVTASILRDVVSGSNEERASTYRLVLVCHAATQVSELQLAWAPIPARGSLAVAMDGMVPIQFSVEGRKGRATGAR